MKYVVVRCTSNTENDKTSFVEYPFVFPTNMVHDHVARSMALLLSFYHPKHKISIVSGGEVSPIGLDEPYGKSDSIGVASRPERDKTLLKMCDYGGMHGDTRDEEPENDQP